MSEHLLHVEVESDSLDEAVEKALSQLNCTRAEAEVEVLQAHSTGFLGLFGKRPARVRVVLHDRGVIVRQVVARLLALTGLEADITIAITSERIDVLISSSDSSRVIGRHGQTLEALQTLSTTIVDRLTTDRTAIRLDVDGYRLRRQEVLGRLAKRLSDKVRASGEPAFSPPLGLYERRTLHELFKREPDLESLSRRHDGERKVVVLQQKG